MAETGKKAKKAKRKAKRPAQQHQQQQQQQKQGHYADPMSPIASTPLKRQRTKRAENAKSAKAKHQPQAEDRGTSVKPKEDGRFFSPRKLSKEFGANDKSAETTPRTLPSTTPVNGKAEDAGYATPTASDAEEVDQEMFSPTLKPPRSSRSASASPARSRARLEALTASAGSTTPEQVVEVADSVTEDEAATADEAEATEVPAEQEFNPFYFMKTLPKYDDIVLEPRPIALPEPSRGAPSICLVLDLDETLVHCSVDEVENPHLQFPVNFNGVDYTVNVKKRPHMEYFLRRVSKTFEVVVFTASHKAYAEKLLNLLDPHGHLIKYRLYREDCLDVYGNYLKDLNVLGRDLSKVVLVDNSPHAFGYQVNNGIPIETWYEDESDDELLNLLPFLESLLGVEDVRPVVEKQFQIQKLIDAAPDDEIV